MYLDIFLSRTSSTDSKHLSCYTILAAKAIIDLQRDIQLDHSKSGDFDLVSEIYKKRSTFITTCYGDRYQQQVTNWRPE